MRVLAGGSCAGRVDAVLDLALGEHHLDRIACALQAGHDPVFQRVDAPRCPRDLAGKLPQAGAERSARYESLHETSFSSIAADRHREAAHLRRFHTPGWVDTTRTV